jgi:hypothetical protein
MARQLMRRFNIVKEALIYSVRGEPFDYAHDYAQESLVEP